MNVNAYARVCLTGHLQQTVTEAAQNQLRTTYLACQVVEDINLDIDEKLDDPGSSRSLAILLIHFVTIVTAYESHYITLSK